MDIKDFRTKVDAALAECGLARMRLFAKQPPVWALPGEVIRFFLTDAQRRPWGFELKGIIGLEIPELRHWLKRYKGDEQTGIFKSYFAAFYSTNEPGSLFSVDLNQPVLAASWAEKIRNRLYRLPPTINDALDAYEHKDDGLGFLVRERNAWEFLREWQQTKDPLLDVPKW
jgi:hypothetical protein